MKLFLKIVVLTAALWTLYWYGLVFTIQTALPHLLATQSGRPTQVTSPSQPRFSGFPGAIVVAWPKLTITTPQSRSDMDLVVLRLWPLPGAPVALDITKLNAHTADRAFDFGLVHIAARLPVIGPEFHVREFAATRGDARIESFGDVSVPFDLKTKTIDGQLNASFVRYDSWIDYAIAQKYLPEKQGKNAHTILRVMALGQDDLTVPVDVKENWVSIGPMRLFSLRPETTLAVPAPDSGSGLPLPQTRSDGSTSSGLPAPVPQILPSGQPQ